MEEENKPSAQQALYELKNLIHKAEQQISAGDSEAEIALQYFMEEIRWLSSKEQLESV